MLQGSCDGGFGIVHDKLQVAFRACGDLPWQQIQAVGFTVVFKSAIPFAVFRCHVSVGDSHAQGRSDVKVKDSTLIKGCAGITGAMAYGGKKISVDVFDQELLVGGGIVL